MSEENENKPNLDVPEHLEYSDEHVWVDASTEPAMVGITEYAADQLGELVYIDLPEVGSACHLRIWHPVHAGAAAVGRSYPHYKGDCRTPWCPRRENQGLFRER